MEIDRFLEKLASDHPTPGGGSASAMAGALSASLVAMAAGFSVKKGKLPREEAYRIKRNAGASQRRLYRAIEEDAKSYESVIRAFHLPKEGERQRLYRSRMIQKAYQKATVTPQVVCERAIGLLEASRRLIAMGNPSTVSDAAVAAYLAHAALEGGISNIRINLTSLKDGSLRKEKEKVIRQLIKKKDRLMGEIQKEIRDRGL